MNRGSKIMVSRAPFLLLCGLLVSVAADAPDCGTTCHVLAYCEGTSAQPYCTCQPGTLDVSDKGNGTDCDINGYTVRFVGNFDLIPFGISEPHEVATLDSVTAKSSFCASDAKGYFVRAVRLGVYANPRNMSLPSVTEVNCLYSEEPSEINSEYAAVASRLGAVRVPPAIYRWVLQTTGAPLPIPPTGMTINSVHFKTTCGESGCWVIKGWMTTGEAFNDFSVFNTFFLPQADITGLDPQGSLSYDYDYSEVEWTFQPANHPCTSADYVHDVEGIVKISTCCIDYPGTERGGFIPNYRPTEAFVGWAEQLRCDEKWIDETGTEVCWKMYRDWTHWPTASRRCAAAGGYLATVPDSDTNQRLQQFLEERGIEHSWIGYRVEEGPNRTSDKFIWDDGKTPAGYENWGPGFPVPVECWGPYYEDRQADPDYDYEHDQIRYISEYCEELKFTYMAPDGTWGVEDQYGGDYPFHMPFVCQFDPPTECISHVIQRPDYSAPEPEEDTCWEVRRDFKPWAEAEADCVNSGGHLATLHDVEDFFFMRRVLEHANADQVWIGLTDSAEEGVWQWSDNTEIGDTAWYEWDFYYFYNADYFDYDQESGQWLPANKDWSGYWIGYAYDYIEDCGLFYGEDAVWRQEECMIPLQYVCNVPVENATVCHSREVLAEDDPWDIPFPLLYQRFLGKGKFKGMSISPGVVAFDNLDPFFGQYSYEIHLDEWELRARAGILRGTVGVEHSVDTFLGLANFRPTGSHVLDTFAMQINIHLEKTSFFTVSTHGTNEYTFLEYVNMRLVQVLVEDPNFSATSESADRTVRTSVADNAAYLQVTFTMGSQYQPNMESGGLIPLDSVRAGLGTFLGDVEDAGGMEHLCSVFDAAAAGDSVGLTGYQDTRQTFVDRMGQACAPDASMCASPSAVPDSFVSFNVPLGFEVLDGKADATLGQQVFVDMVVNAIDTLNKDPTAPNAGGAPLQMKTTLSASIPIVEGGVNIFCDGFIAKTDLKDVADADIIVGSAASLQELTRLRILEDVASTDLASVTPRAVDSDSIEAGLLTLVLKGNASYFAGSGRNTLDFSLELDDLITLHLMEDGSASTSTKEAAVTTLLGTPGEDNSDSNGLDTDGYLLNGAFSLSINRAAGTASLEPTDQLLAVCPFNPPRPLNNNPPLETCVLRRDVRARGYPARAGGVATAMEVLAVAAAKDGTEAAVDGLAAGLDESSGESAFLATILGDNVYAAQLAPNFARAIHDRYDLNGRYRRAYWINPGYEWTPTQTAGTPLFAVSQKIFLFALITMDENWQRRRMLLQTAAATDALQEAGSGLAAQAVSFDGVSARSMLAGVYDVPEDKVAALRVRVQLTAAEACMAPAEQQNAIRGTLAGVMEESASPHHAVQVTRMQVDLADERCTARRLRRRLLAFSSATADVEALVVFKEGQRAVVNLAAVESAPAVASAEADSNQGVAFEDSYRPPSYWGTDPEEESGSDNTMVIAGVAGGAGAALVLGIGAVMYLRRREPEAEVVAPVQSLQDLKGELSHELNSNLSGEDLLPGTAF